MQKKQIGQLFIVGYQGEEPSDEFLSFVEEWGIGGIVVFARNLTDPDKLPGHIKKIEEAAGQKIFASIDQEGGLVMRILSRGSLFPSAMGLAATGSAELTEASHYAMGKEMLSLGLNWNLAPVLDINHPDNPGIGARSFGDRPEQVSLHGSAAIRGLQKAGVLACAKHFPGNGHAHSDPHLTLPIIPYPAEHLHAFELLPFKKAIEADVAAIMTAHIFFPAFEASKDLPATLSRSVLTGLLRDQLKFKGILVTDDLEMGAITESFGIAQAASMSFHAGADLLLICHRLDQQRLTAETLLKQAQENKETARRVEESLARIAAARKRLPETGSTGTISDWQRKHVPLIKELHEKSIKFLRCSPKMIPMNGDGSGTFFVLPQISSLVQVEEEHKQGSLVKVISAAYPKAATFVYEPKCPFSEFSAGIDKLNINTATRVVFFTYNGHLFKDQLQAVRSIRAKTENIAVVALRNPYDLAECHDIATCAATFGFRTPAISAFLDVLAGRKKPEFSDWPVDSTRW